MGAKNSEVKSEEDIRLDTPSSSSIPARAKILVLSDFTVYREKIRARSALFEKIASHLLFAFEPRQSPLISEFGEAFFVSIFVALGV